MAEFNTLTPQQAWDKLHTYRWNYYNHMSAMYSGNHDDLKNTAEQDTFWKRPHVKCRIHVPMAADIASVSANLQFSQEPTYTISRNGEDMQDSEQQKRLEYILLKNSFANKLNEGAETCAALGDVYLKLRWNKSIQHPIIDVVQPDQAWPEYILGQLRCVHFFTEIVVDADHDKVIRAYECYTKGKIVTKMFSGSNELLGTPMSDKEMKKFGLEKEITTPIDELLAVHIANIRPNRRFRSSMLGRSDLDGLRDLCDSLDEAYSSWMRDIRLAKARLIVPAEYLRKKPSRMPESIGERGIWEFDPDVEAYVAMDINTDAAGGSGITPSQFAIRASEHKQTCDNLVLHIIQTAGYSPQSFGLNIEGTAQSGSALNIRERKSATTSHKKCGYWQSPLETILTAMIRLDHALYPNNGSLDGDIVNVEFADAMGSDPATTAATVDAITRAQAASTLTKVRMLHPEWSEKQVDEEVERIKNEYGFIVESPDAGLGDYENDGDGTKKPEGEGKVNE